MSEIIFDGVLVHFVAKLLLACDQLCHVLDVDKGHVFIVLDLINLLDANFIVPYMIFFALL
jgi:hypothetical protein